MERKGQESQGEEKREEREREASGYIKEERRDDRTGEGYPSSVPQYHHINTDGEKPAPPSPSFPIRASQNHHVVTARHVTTALRAHLLPQPGPRHAGTA